MSDKPDPWIHKALPMDAQADLKAAAQTPITPEDPLARVKAIDHAIQRVKQRYPHLFKE